MYIYIFSIIKQAVKRMNVEDEYLMNSHAV